MKLADGVGGTSQPQREAGHVELGPIALDPEAQLEDAVDRHAARLRPAVAVEQRSGDLADEIGGEPLVPGRHGSVDREDAVVADPAPGLIERRSGRDVLARTLGEQERRVALVQVPDGRFDPECPDRPDAADPEDELLVEAHLPAADVQDVGDRTIGVGVLRNVRVEQENRGPTNLGAPYGDLEVAVGQLDGDLQGLAVGALGATDREARQVEVRVGVLLVPIGVDRLVEVAVAIHQADADERERHVGRGLRMVAGEHAEAAGLDPE